MTREEIEKNLEPLEWQHIGSYDDEDIAAPTHPMSYWYIIFKNEKGYIVEREGPSRSIVKTIAEGIETLEMAKKIAWHNYVDQVLRLFKRKS
jgi:hypothetical protein